MNLAEREIRSYVPEPERGKRHWAGKADEQQCVYANRRRVRAERSKRLQKLRGELCERSFAHCYETGGLRRMYVRGEDNVFKRVLVQVAAFNIGLLLRKLSGWGKPRQAQGKENAALALVCAALAFAHRVRAVWSWATGFPPTICPEALPPARRQVVFG